MFMRRSVSTLFGPTFLGKQSWMMSHAQAPATLVLDDRVRVYFSTRGAPESSGDFTSLSTWIDLDRERFGTILNVSHSPVLQLGSRGCFDEFGVYPFSALSTGSRVVGYYGGWTRTRSVPFNVSIGTAESFDGGESFQRCGEGPILTARKNEPFIISGPKIRKFGETLYLFYIAGTRWLRGADRYEPEYRIRLATSRDGEQWHRSGIPIIETSLGAGEAQASPDVFFLNDRYHMLFCYRDLHNYRYPPFSYRLGYAWSDDLEVWNRDDSQIDFRSQNSWDSEMIAYPHVLLLDGKIFLFYIGNGFGRDGFGLAELAV